jgi:septal ring factor EnvC (AmiA/AmiB activator)
VTKWKLVIAVIICLGLAAFIFFVGRGVGVQGVDKQLKEAEAEVQRLKGEKASLEKGWASKETSFADKIKGLNNRLVNLQKENNVLENRIAEYQRQRESIVVPDSADGIANGFRKRGIRSATACPRPR